MIVMEIQKSDKVATIVTAYEDRDEAESKYHTILASASKSKVPVHSAVMITDDGYYVKSESYKHEVDNG